LFIIKNSQSQGGKIFMKKRITKLLAVLLIILTLGLASCDMDRANTYNAWKNGSTDVLPKNHIVEKTDLGGVLKKMNAQSNESDEIFYVFYGNVHATGASNAIQVYNEQAVQFQIKTLYWIDSDMNDKKRTELEDKLGISNADIVPALYAFKHGAIVFDSSTPYYANNSGDYTTIKLAQIAFRQLFDENGEYSYND
jgi:hypothetical protein